MASARQRLGDLEPSLLLLLTIFLLLILGVSLDSLSPTVKLAGSTIGLVLSAGWWLVRRREVGRDLQAAGPLLTPLLVYFLVRSILLVRSPLLRPAFETILQELTLLIFFLFVCSSLSSRWRVRTWEDALVLISIALSLVEAIFVYAWLHEWWSIGEGWLPPVGYQASGLLLGHPNVLAGFIALVLPLLTARVVTAPTRSARIQRTIPFLILLVILFFTSSRGGWVAAALGVLVTGSLLALGRSRSVADAVNLLSKRLRALPKWQLITGAAVILAAAYLALWQITRTGHGPISRARLPVWDVAWRMLQNAPLLGNGPGSFPLLFASISPYAELDIPHAHNLLLQVLDETGLVGLAALGWLIGAVGAILARAWVRADAEQRGRLAAYLGAGTALLSHNMIDFLFGPPLYTAAALILLALAVQTASGLQPDRPPPRLTAVPLILLAIVIPIGLLICLRGAWDYWTGVEYARAGDWGLAAGRVCESAADHPEPVYQEACGLARSMVEGFSYEPSVSAEFAMAVAADPYWGYHWSNLSLADWTLGEDDRAIAEMDRAVQAMPSETSLAIMRGYQAERVGDLATAREFYRQALTENPWLIQDDFFRASSEDRYAGTLDEVSASWSETNRILWSADAAIHASKLQEAQELIDRAGRLSPNNGLVYALRARLAMAQGQQETAWKWVQIGRFIQPTDLRVNIAYAEVGESLGMMDSAREALTVASQQVYATSRSQRYYFASYGRTSLPIDRVPVAFRPAPVPNLKGFLENAARDPAWTSGADPGQIAAWELAAEVLGQWR